MKGAEKMKGYVESQLGPYTIRHYSNHVNLLEDGTWKMLSNDEYMELIAKYEEWAKVNG
jgi:hypothetical protein